MPSLNIKLEEKIQSRHMLNHSFYTRWQRGQLSREELKGYAKEYYVFEKEFPRFLSAIHTKCEDQKTRQMILENLVHEETGPENHLNLWKQFAGGMGVSRQELDSHFHSDETEHLLKTFRKFTKEGDLQDGIAALYAYERQQPEVARQKISGLKAFYGVSDESVLSFFKAHQTYDIYHSETESSILNNLCQDEKTQSRAVAVVDETLQALYEFLDGVERRYGDPTNKMTC